MCLGVWCFKRMSSKKILDTHTGVEAYIMMNIKTGTEEETCQMLAKLPHVQRVDLIYGEYDAIIKVETEDMSTLKKFTEELRNISNIFLTATMLIAKNYKA